MSRTPGLLILLLLMAAAGCARRGPEENAIRAENRLPGDPDWELRHPAEHEEIEGYADRVSAAPGDSLSFHVSTRSPSFDTRIYRLGWYGGAGARLCLEIPGTPGVERARPRPRREDGLVACDWPASVRLRIPNDWRSGVYLARLTSAESLQAFIPFVVREGAGAHRASILVPVNVTTWQAYNAWGGMSLYDFNSDGGVRALRVSFDRPYGSGPGAWRGLGAGELLTTPHTRRKAGWEYPMLRWLERRGYDVAYAADLDLRSDSGPGDGRRLMLLVGHPEYWSRGTRDALERARDQGVDLAFFAGNAGYWQVRLEPSPDGRSDRVLFCAKDHTRDPLFDTEADRDLTVRFRNLHPRRPELALLGVMTDRAEESVEADWVPDPGARASWVLRGTRAARVGTGSIPGLVGYEVDRSFVGDSLYGPWSPPGLVVVAHSPIGRSDGGTQGSNGSARYSEATVYEARSGAMVFAVGTVQWSWGLDDWGAPELRPARYHPDAERITINVIERASARRGRGP